MMKSISVFSKKLRFYSYRATCLPKGSNYLAIIFLSILLSLALFFFAWKAAFPVDLSRSSCLSNFSKYQENELSPFKFSNEKYGYVNIDGSIVSQPIFYTAKYFSEGLANVSVDENRGYGYVNSSGCLQIPWSKKHSLDDFANGLAIFQDLGNYKYGFMNKEGTAKVKPQFDSVNNFSEQLAVVTNTGKHNYINADGKKVISEDFVSASSFADGRALVSDNSLDLQGKYYFIDSSGKNPYQTSFFAALSYSDGLALVTRNKGDKPEFINLMGNRVSPLDFDASRAGYNSFNNGFLVISVQDSPLVAYVDKNFRRIVEFDATGIAPEIQEFSEGMLAIRRKVGRKWEYIDGNGNTVIPPVFLWTSEFRNGLASVSWADRKGRVYVGMVDNKKQLFYYDFSWRRGEYIKKQCVISSDEKTVECQ